MWYPMELHRTTAKRASKQPLDCGSTTGRGGDASHTVLEFGETISQRSVSGWAFAGPFKQILAILEMKRNALSTHHAP